MVIFTNALNAIENKQYVVLERFLKMQNYEGKIDDIRNLYGMTLLMYLCKKSEPTVMEVFLKRYHKEINPNIKDSEKNTALHHAAENDNLAALEMLLDLYANKIDINCRNS